MKEKGPRNQANVGDYSNGEQSGKPGHSQHSKGVEAVPQKHQKHQKHQHEEHQEHGRHEGHSTAEFRKRFFVCLVLTIPILVYSQEVQGLLGFRAPVFPGSAYLPFVLGTIVYFYGGIIFLRGVKTELTTTRPGMMTLIAMAISVAFVFSLAATFGLVDGALWWELSTLVVIMLLGHWLEMRSVGKASGALKELAKLLPDQAERITDGGTETVGLDALEPDNHVLVRPGARIPTDGVVTEGASAVNEAMITGESVPVEKGEGDEVIGGTLNTSGSLRVRVTKLGEQSALGGIMRLVGDAQASRSRSQDLADRAAFVLTLVALIAGLGTLLVWLALGESFSFSIQRTVTVMVISCPHALGLAIPLVVAISTAMAAGSGLLIRKRDAFERARKLQLVVFDKTGTLTEGEFGVAGMATLGGFSEEEALRLAGAAEADSEHVMARAIVKEAQSRGLELPSSQEFRALPGRGVSARVDYREVMVGLKSLALEAGEIPEELAIKADEGASRGQSVIYLLVDGRPQAVFMLADTIRPESKEAVRNLKRNGVQVAMLTGDSEEVAKSVASQLEIDEYFARILPEEKSRRIAELRDRGQRVAMVGDGVNDAPALLAADVGIAIGAGTNVAVEAGDIVLVRNDPRDIARVIRLSRATYQKMVQNLIWATGYNVVAIPLAAGVLAGYGIVLAPATGAILMTASTIIVAINAQLLRGRKKELQ